jgi:hypothetical protein
MWKYGSHNMKLGILGLPRSEGGIPSRVETHQWSSLFGSPLADVSVWVFVFHHSIPMPTPRVAAGPAKVKKVSSSEELRKGYAEALELGMGEWTLAFGISADWMENQRWMDFFAWLFIFIRLQVARSCVV